MVDRINNTHEGETKRPQPAQTASSNRSNIDTPRIDDVIVALANARENRRARQVNEWERLYHGRRV